MTGRAVLLLIVAIGLPGCLHAAQSAHVEASHAWIRLLPADLPAGGYVNLKNDSPSAVVLVSAHSDTYASVMLHQSSMGPGGQSSMAMIDRLAIPPQGGIDLAPAGYHLMLQRARHPLKPGDTVDITLDFADGSHLPVQFLVRPANTVE
ncbi:copper chaperone PCu(A)C [Dyella jejuensis]|uniref:Copper chaperone PCu(A)C n=1 Tax=Dyella jejuensis TaxID=1432009 RepID=A0ABW8JE42_9GAMM